MGLCGIYPHLPILNADPLKVDKSTPIKQLLLRGNATFQGLGVKDRLLEMLLLSGRINKYITDKARIPFKTNISIMITNTTMKVLCINHVIF